MHSLENLNLGEFNPFVIDNLPDDCFNDIIFYLDYKSFCAAATVSTNWNEKIIKKGPLPKDCLSEILAHVAYNSFFSAATVSKEWNAKIVEPVIQQSIKIAINNSDTKICGFGALPLFPTQVIKKLQSNELSLKDKYKCLQQALHRPCRANETVLFDAMAYYSGNKKTLEIALQCNANIEYLPPRHANFTIYCPSLLFKAINDNEAFKFLIDNGADASIKNEMGQTVFDYGKKCHYLLAADMEELCQYAEERKGLVTDAKIKRRAIDLWLGQ